MKNILAILFMLVTVSLWSQAPLLFSSRLNVTNVIGSDPYTLTGVVQDELSLWSAADINAANDSIYHLEGSDLLIYRITSISSASGNNFVIVVDDIMNSGILPSTGTEWAAVEFTANFQFPSYIGNLSSPFKAVIDNRFKQRLSNAIIGATISVAQGLSIDGSVAELGNDTGETTATLSSSREIPMGGNNITLTGQGYFDLTSSSGDLLGLGMKANAMNAWWLTAPQLSTDAFGTWDVLPSGFNPPVGTKYNSALPSWYSEFEVNYLTATDTLNEWYLQGRKRGTTQYNRPIIVGWTENEDRAAVAVAGDFNVRPFDILGGSTPATSLEVNENGSTYLGGVDGNVYPTVTTAEAKLVVLQDSSGMATLDLIGTPGGAPATIVFKTAANGEYARMAGIETEDISTGLGDYESKLHISTGNNAVSDTMATFWRGKLGLQNKAPDVTLEVGDTPVQSEIAVINGYTTMVSGAGNVYLNANNGIGAVRLANNAGTITASLIDVGYTQLRSETQDIGLYSNGSNRMYIRSADGFVTVGNSTNSGTKFGVVGGDISAAITTTASAGSPLGPSVYLADAPYGAGSVTLAPGLTSLYNATYGLAADLGLYAYHGISGIRTKFAQGSATGFTVTSLAGSGSRIVVADANGLLSTSTISTLSSTLAVGSALSMTTATPRNIDTLVLTAGTWLVSGNVNFSESAATTTEHVAGITTTSATIPTDGTQVYSNTQSVLLSGIDGITIPSKVVIVATGTTNVYLVGSTTFSAGTSAGFGSILAWKL